MPDRFRPDAAVRRIAGHSPDRVVIDDPRCVPCPVCGGDCSSANPPPSNCPVAAAREAVGAAIRDAIESGVVSGMKDLAEAARASFEPRGPIGHKGRSSLPKSHRAEGVNYVD